MPYGIYDKISIQKNILKCEPIEINGLEVHKKRKPHHQTKIRERTSKRRETSRPQGFDQAGKTKF